MDDIDQFEAFRRMIEENPARLALIDPESISYVIVNHAMAENFGYTREELMARGPRALYGESIEAMRRGYRQVIEAHPKSLVRVGPLRRADGTTFATEHQLRAVRVGDRWLIAVSGVDIAEKMQAFAGIERLNAAIAQSSEGVAVIDAASLRYIEVNEACARIFGYTRDELMALGPQALRVSLGLPPNLRELYDHMVSTSPQVHLDQGWLSRPDGSRFYAQASRKAVSIGGQWLIVANTRDLTKEQLAQAELERSVAELKRSNEELEKFAYAASHDLSEPLRMIAGYTELLQRRYGDRFDDDAREFMDYVVSGAQRMRRLIDDLLTYSRAGRKVQGLRPVPLEAVMRDVTSNLERLVKERAPPSKRRGCRKSWATGAC